MWRQLHFKEKDLYEAERLRMSDKIIPPFMVFVKE